MKLFFHISNFDRAGTRTLPAMLFLSDRLHVWAPSKSLIDQAGGVFTAEDFLRAVKRRDIQVVSRENWVCNREFRGELTKRWEQAEWTDFDDRVLALHKEGKAELETDKMVRLAKEEGGRDWARTQLLSKSDAVERAQGLYERRQLPPGWLDKADKEAGRARTPDQQVFAATMSILRDSWNHLEAQELVGSHLPVEPTQFPETASLIVGRPSLNPLQGAPDREPQEAAEQFIHLLEIASRLAQPRDADDVFAVLDDPEYRDLRVSARSLLREPNAATSLHHAIESGAKPIRWLRDLLPGELDGKLVLATGVLTGVLTNTLAGAGVPLLISTVVRGGLVVGRKSGLIHAKYDGPRWPFMLACGTKDPTYAQMQQVLGAVKKHFD